MLKIKNLQVSSTVTVFIHIITWLLVLHLVFNLLGLLESAYVTLVLREQYIDEAFIVIPILIAMFYWNGHYLVVRFLNRQSWWKYMLWLGLSFITLFYLGIYLQSLCVESGYETMETVDFFDYALILHLVVIGISTSFGISIISMRNAAQKKQEEEKRKEAELKYLSNQFNPHFLFNTLNGIYALSAEEEATKTTEAILKLSEIMRYPIKEGSNKKVLLSKEVEFVQDYIALKKMRLGEDYPIAFDQEGQFENIEVAPLLFISIVENAFKYGVSQKKRSPILFSLRVQERQLFFSSQNEINSQSDSESHQTGLSNLRHRLDLLYGQEHLLEWKITAGKYCVDLQIKV